MENKRAKWQVCYLKRQTPLFYVLEQCAHCLIWTIKVEMGRKENEKENGRKETEVDKGGSWGNNIYLSTWQIKMNEFLADIFH